MATAERERILLALDACSELSAALAESVVNMAARLDADLEGLFVEDAELLRAAELPFVSEVSAAGEERAFDVARVRALNRDLSKELERLLARAAGARRVGWRYTTREGRRVVTACAAAEHCDLFVPGRAARRRTTTRAAGEFTRVGLVVQPLGGTARALSVIHALASNGHTREVVLVCEGRPPADLVAALAGERLRTYVQAAPMSEPRELLARLRPHEPGLVVAPKALLLPPASGEALESLPMSLLLLR